MLCHAALLGLGALHFPQGTAGEQLPEATQSPFLSHLSCPRPFSPSPPHRPGHPRLQSTALGPANQALRPAVKPARVPAHRVGGRGSAPL